MSTLLAVVLQHGIPVEAFALLMLLHVGALAVTGLVLSAVALKVLERFPAADEVLVGAILVVAASVLLASAEVIGGDERFMWRMLFLSTGVGIGYAVSRALTLHRATSGGERRRVVEVGLASVVFTATAVVVLVVVFLAAVSL